jgi:hypothetical protein
MPIIYLDKLDTESEILRRLTFPAYSGRKFQVELTETINFSGTQWAGGSKTDYRIVQLDGMKVVGIPEAPFLQRSPLHEGQYVLPPGYVVVSHHISCGKDLGLTFSVNPRDSFKLLPKPTEELTRAEKIVLVATGLKSSYGGIKDLRFHEAHEKTGISRQEYDQAKELLIKKGLLNKAGAITPQGKNAINVSQFNFRPLARLEDFREMTKGRYE